MGLGPNDPRWEGLASALRDLATAANATNAFVVNPSGLVWCRAHQVPRDLYRMVMQETRNALARLTTPLARGGQLEHACADPENPAYFKSYAGVYVLVLWFAAPYQPLAVRKLVNEALPRIEELTLALPPTDGTPAEGVAAKQRA